MARVNFIYDGLSLSPGEYIEKLSEIDKGKTIEPDIYGNGGVTKSLEDEFAKITGKEKAIYLPSGTMANQLAINLLNGKNTKVIVPENSHIYRDEADAAQSVFGKRLLPVGKDKAFFDLNEMKEVIFYTKESEVFDSGLGTVLIENPVRRADNTFVPVKTVKEISTYCKENNYSMHLDGSRLHIASAYSGISISEYSSYFDTVYISLYKYLNAAGGAILCGDSVIIDRIPYLIKVYGGTVFQTWYNTSVAISYLDGIEDRWKEIIQKTNELILALNEIEGVEIIVLENGTNVYDLNLEKRIKLKELANYLFNEHNIWLGRANENGVVKFTVNESLLTRNINEIINAWKSGIEKARE